MLNKKITGFTIIELIFVTAIIVTITSAGFMGYSTYMKNARDSRRKLDIEKIHISLERYRSIHNKYPSNLTELENQNIISVIPKDPFDGNDGFRYVYEYNQVTDTFKIRTKLEKKNENYEVTSQ